MIEHEYPDLKASGRDPNAPCPDVGWPTFVFNAPTRGYEADKHYGPVSVKWVTRGVETYEICGLPIDVTQQRLLILGDGQEYESRAPFGVDTTSFCVFFERGFVSEAIGVSALELFPRTVDASSALAHHMCALHTLITTDHEHMVLEQQLYGVLGAVLDVHRITITEAELVPARKRSTRMEVYKRLLLAMAYMDGKCADTLSLTEIARAVSMSPYHFLRAFRETTGQTPFRFVCARRIERAKHLLRADSDSVAVIAEKVGFESHTSFHAAFRKHTGETPDIYRRKAF